MLDEKYIIAVDGGGSKTEFCICNIHTDERVYVRVGSTNYKTIGERMAEKNLIDGFEDLIKEYKITYDNIAMVVFGISGCDNEDDTTYYRTIIDELHLPKEKVYLCNDAEIAFYSAGSVPGMVVVGGTGTICMGFDNKGNQTRLGGWGFPISDLGSGNWIASKVLQHLVKYCDGYGEYCKVFNRIKRELGCEQFSDIPEQITGYKLSDLAYFARHAVTYAHLGDKLCFDLVDEATDHIVDLAEATFKRMHFPRSIPVDIIVSGGLFKDDSFRDTFIAKFSQRIYTDNISFKEAGKRPVDGGINLGLMLVQKVKS